MDLATAQASATAMAQAMDLALAVAQARAMAQAMDLALALASARALAMGMARALATARALAIAMDRENKTDKNRELIKMIEKWINELKIDLGKQRVEQGMNKTNIDTNDVINMINISDIDIGSKYYNSKQGFVNTTELAGFMEGLQYFRATLLKWIIDKIDHENEWSDPFNILDAKDFPMGFYCINSHNNKECNGSNGLIRNGLVFQLKNNKAIVLCSRCYGDVKW